MDVWRAMLSEKLTTYHTLINRACVHPDLQMLQGLLKLIVLEICN